jgi:hypothetical protein
MTDIMEWINAHWKDIAAGIGALYALALVIVKLTPTPKDDEALKKVSVILKVIAKVFGLNLKQGITKKNVLLCLVAGSMCCSSCAMLSGLKEDPKKQYHLAASVYAESVNTLATLRRAGKIREKDAEAINRVVILGHDILKAWAAALNECKDYPGVSHMAPILLQLKEFAIVEDEE